MVSRPQLDGIHHGYQDARVTLEADSQTKKDDIQVEKTNFLIQINGGKETVLVKKSVENLRKIYI